MKILNKISNGILTRIRAKFSTRVLISISIIASTFIYATSVAPIPAHSQVETKALNYFSMGYFHLYDDDIPMALKQFELALQYEKNPPALLYSILSELSNILGRSEDARQYAMQALEIDPGNESALQMMAFVLLKDRQFGEAASYLERLLGGKPDDVQVLFYLAEAYKELENDDKLIEVYRKILQYRPDLVEVSLNLGYLYIKKGAFGLAEKEYRRVLDSDPENAKALFYLTYIYFSTGRSAEAGELFKKLDDRELLNDRALEDYALNLFIEGQNPSPVLERIIDENGLSVTAKAVLQFLDGNLMEATRLFEQAVVDDPNQIAALVGLIRIAERTANVDMEKKWRFMLAGSYYGVQMLEKATEEAERVREIDAGFLENRYLLGDIYSALGRTRAAIGEYEYFKENAEETGDIFVKLGISYDEIGRHEEAIESFRSAIEQFSENAELYYFLGIEYRIVKDYRNAVEAFKRAVELNRDNARYYFNLGVSYERLGSIDEAILHLDRSVKLDDSNAAALNYLGYLLADEGIRLNEAKTFIEKALDIDPDNGAYLDSMGWVYYRLADYAKAREYLENAVQYMDPSDEENYLIYDHLGDIYYKLEIYQKAIDAWKKALELKFVEEIQRKIQKAEGEQKD